MGTKTFQLGDVLSITDGRLLSPRLMDGVYDILNHLTGCGLMTHELPKAVKLYQPLLLAKFPALEGCVPKEVDGGNWQSVIDSLVEKHGDSFDVESNHELWQSVDRGVLGNLAEML